MAVPRIKPGNYPAVLSYGFRPFFLLGSFYAGLSILIWLPLFYGYLETYSFFSPADWHIHEMLFGYLGAIITGFLLTAIPNWTGRLPVQGGALFILIVVWLLGRFAVFFSQEIGWLSAVIDCAFLCLVVATVATEIIAGKNWQNLKILLPITILFAANVLFYVEFAYTGTTDISRRLGIGMILILLTVIGGRIIPSFTRNWLARGSSERLPIAYNRFDKTTIILTALTIILWVFFPVYIIPAVAMILVALLQSARLWRWAGIHAISEPLVVILHIAYAFVPIGLLLIGLAVIIPDFVTEAAGIHAIGVGAFGGMSLAVMTRSSLSHTGRKLEVNTATCVIYTAIIISAICRIVVTFLPVGTVLLHLSALSWLVAFWGFTLCFGTMLVTARLTR